MRSAPVPSTTDDPGGARRDEGTVRPLSRVLDGARSGLLIAVLRRSTGLTSLPIMIAIMAGQVMLRDRMWSHEWGWTLYQLGFDTVLLGPVVAGVGAWEGVRLARSEELYHLAVPRRGPLLVVLTWVAIWMWTAVAFLAGTLLAVALTSVAGTPGGPTPRELFTLLPPLTLLSAEAAIGLAFGRFVARGWAAPIAAAGCFAVTIWLYSNGPGQFITVGGATGSLVGLQPRLPTAIAQVAFFLTASLAACAVAWRGAKQSLPDSLLTLGWSLPAVGTAILLLALGGQMLESHPTPLECVDRDPQICVAGGYLGHAHRAHDVLAAYLAALHDARVANLPQRFEQDAIPGQRTVGPLTNTFLLGDETQAPNLIISALVSKRCVTDKAMNAAGEIQWWLQTTVGQMRTEDPALPPALTTGTRAQQYGVLREDFATLDSCAG